MNLVIDIGNTSVKVGIFEHNNIIDTRYQAGCSLSFLTEYLKDFQVTQAIIASVIELDESNSQWLEKNCFPVIKLDHTTPIPITNLYKSPQTLGYDRLAAVVGANEQFPGRDILVVDAGTAITYEFIDAQDRYHGGNISPGMQMRFKALNQYTGRLPLVKAEGKLLSMGEDTETAIRAGVIKGIEFEISGYITSLKHKYPELLVFLTGGDEFSFDTNVKNIIFADSFLVLKGLNRILNYNNGRI